MKKINITNLLVSALFVLATPLFAEEASPLEVASTEVIQDALTTCKEYAVEDGVPPADLQSYLLDCVNNELDNYAFKAITQLPK